VHGWVVRLQSGKEVWPDVTDVADGYLNSAGTRECGYIGVVVGDGASVSALVAIGNIQLLQWLQEDFLPTGRLKPGNTDHALSHHIMMVIANCADLPEIRTRHSGGLGAYRIRV